MESSFSSYLLCMKNDAMTTLQRLLILFALFSTNTFSQQSTSVPRFLQIGPKGMDTTAFAEIVVFRDSAVQYDNMWFSVMFDQPVIPVAAINPGRCYIIRTKKEGRHTLYTKTYWADGIELSLEHGKRYYMVMEVIKQEDKPRTLLTLLNEEEGKKRFLDFNGRRMVRYMSLNDENHNYLEDRHPDSLRWRAGNALFHFKRPPFLEIIIAHQIMVFHQPSISKTYSEYMTIMEIKRREIKDTASFLLFAETTGKEELKGESGSIELTRIPMIRNDLPYAIAYYVDNENASAPNKGGAEHLHERSVYMYLFVPEYNKRKGYYTILLSERGRLEELSTKAELIDKFNYVWDSMSISEE